MKALLHDLFDDDSHEEGEACEAGMPAEEVGSAQHTAGSAVGGSRKRAAPPVQQEQQQASKMARTHAGGVPEPEPQSLPLAPEAAVQHVTDQVRGFVQSLAKPLLRSKVIDEDMYHLVCARAVAKVMQRHAGASDAAAFLVKECGSITSLVMSLVEFYKKSKKKAG